MIDFAWPWLFTLLPLPWLIYRFATPASRQEAALRVPFFNSISTEAVSSETQGGGNKRSLLLLTLCWVALLTAAARPLWIGDPIELPTSGRDLMLAVDISESMKLQDMQIQNQRVDRLVLVKKVVGEFVEKRKGDRLGLILFGTQAYLQSPLTFDLTTVQQLLQETQIGFAGGKTAIGDAIGLAVKRLRKRPESSRVLILLTDGENTAGEISPLQAAQLAAQEKIKIYTIGIGAEEMIEPGLFGGSFGSRRINPSANLDEDTLTQIALSTGGRYFRARDEKELESIYAILDQLEPVEQKAELYRPINALYFWPLSFAMICSLLLAISALISAPPWRRSDTMQQESAGL
jgi:Ca-activated chloride channel family protein